MPKYWLGLAILALAGPLFAASPGVRAEFVGGTVDVPAKTALRLDLTAADTLILLGSKEPIEVPFTKVRTLEYGQTVGRRYAAAIVISPVLLLSKSRKHFVTIGYEDAQARQQAVVLRVEKGDIRSVLASLEARTGRRVEYLDNEARKGAK